MFSIKPPEPRKVNGVTILGPDLFASDQEGKPLSPIASIFPRYRVLVTGRGIHSIQAAMMLEFLKKNLLDTEHRDLSEEEEAEVYENAVVLLVRDLNLLIRSDPKDMDRIFAADALLQKLLPKERVQFTGIHLDEVRKMLRRRGESWRISPPPSSVEEIVRYIQSSRVNVSTGTTFYQNAPSGGRFLTYEEFMRIRPLLSEDRTEALSRLKEIVHLTRLINNQGVCELSFFLPPEKSLAIHTLEKLTSNLEKTAPFQNIEESKKLFDRFAASFAVAAGPELTADGENYVAWRTTMFCRLCDIDEKTVEEWTLGLSPEFYLNVSWLPGARIVGGKLFFDPNAKILVRSLITHFSRTWPGVVSINVGRVETSQTERDLTGEERQVFLVVLELSDGREEIRHLRMVKWDVMHRLKRGVPLDRAIDETIEYRDYIFDRLRAVTELIIPIPSFTEIRLQEEIPGLGPIPVFFFDRQYVPGMVTDKIPPGRYSQEGFVVRLANLLGVAAAASLVLGRKSHPTGDVLFDDGDELIQLDDKGLPDRLIIVETTGSFTDWSTPMCTMLPHCLSHLRGHLEKAHEKGIQQQELGAAVDQFAEALVEEVARIQKLLHERPLSLRSLFEDRALDPGGIRSRWEGILTRIETTDTRELRQIVAESPLLTLFRDE